MSTSLIVQSFPRVQFYELTVQNLRDENGGTIFQVWSFAWLDRSYLHCD